MDYISGWPIEKQNLSQPFLYACQKFHNIVYSRYLQIIKFQYNLFKHSFGNQLRLTHKIIMHAKYFSYS